MPGIQFLHDELSERSGNTAPLNSAERRGCCVAAAAYGCLETRCMRAPWTPAVEVIWEPAGLIHLNSIP
jgi:hypothetical protein